MKEPQFLTLEEVLEFHKDQIERFGGQHGVRDMGLVESAIAMPQATFGGEFLHPSLVEMGAAYAYHLSENQPFLDGNKRVALSTAVTFLKLNGIALEDPKGTLFDAMIKVGTRQWTKAQLAEHFKKLIGSKRRK